MRVEGRQGIEENGGIPGQASGQPVDRTPVAGTADQILEEIRAYCRATQTAESTFGRLAVNDGKLVSRLRDGARITTGTLDKVRAYLAQSPAAPRVMPGKPPLTLVPSNAAAAATVPRSKVA